MRHAFVVGCSEYKSSEISKLPFVKNDATAMHQFLVDDAFGNAAKSSPCVLNPTRKQLLNELGRFLKSLDPSDSFILYFAGHAARLRSGKWTYYCADTQLDQMVLTSFSSADLKSLIRNSSAQSGILIFDTCYAAAASQISGSRSGDQIPVFRDKDMDDVVDSQRVRNLAILSACGAEDLTLEKNGHGVFTYFLLDTLRKGIVSKKTSEFILPQDAIDQIRRNLSTSKLNKDEKLWPGCHCQGSVSGLYLCRNSKYDGSQQQSQDFSAEQDEDPVVVLNELLESLGWGTQTIDGIDSLWAIGRAISSGDPVPNVPIRIRRYVSSIGPLFLMSILGAAFFAVIFSWIITQFGVNENRTFHYIWFCALIFGVIFSPIWIYSTKRRKDFIFVTSVGFGEYCYRSRDRSSFFLVPWRAVGSIKFLFGDMVIDLDNQYYVRPRNVKNGGIFASFEKLENNRVVICLRGNDYEGGNDVIYEDLQWGKQLCKNLLEEQAHEIKSPEVLSPGTDGHRTYALVGVAAYDMIPLLEAPPWDVDALTKLLVATEDMGDNLRVCKDPDAGTLDQFVADISVLSEHRHLVLYFSGHGIRTLEGLYLALTDTNPAYLRETAFPVEKLVDILHEKQIAHCTLILDCCFSGLAGNDMKLSFESIDSMEDILGRSYRDQLTVVAAAKANAEAFESDSGGLFTQECVKAVAMIAKERGDVTVRDLVEELQKSSNGKQQYQFFSSDVGMAQVIVPRTSALHEGEASVRQELLTFQRSRRDRERKILTALCEKILRHEVDINIAGVKTLELHLPTIFAPPASTFTRRAINVWKSTVTGYLVIHEEGLIRKIQDDIQVFAGSDLLKIHLEEHRDGLFPCRKDVVLTMRDNTKQILFSVKCGRGSDPGELAGIIQNYIDCYATNYTESGKNWLIQKIDMKAGNS